MQRIGFPLNGTFGSFVSKLKRKKQTEEKTIPESKSVQHCFRQPEKDEGALDEMIQRLIAVELRKHRDKQRISIKRTYSDSETIVHKKTNKRRKPINLNPLSLNLERKKQGKSYSQSAKSEKTKDLTNDVGKNATFRDETVEGPVENDEPDKAKKVEILRAETETAENVDSIPHEQKLDSHNAEIPVGDVKDILPTNSETGEKQIRDQKNQSTQTENCYLVRTSRSCPLQKKQLTSHLHLHLNHATNNKKIQKDPLIKDFSSINLSIYRKASDNLIYEKHKGSGSPSYIPTPERFRWKYLLPKKDIKEDIKSNCKEKFKTDLKI